jgi:hypothetical protein
MMLRVAILVITGFISVLGSDASQEFRLPNGLRVFLSENHERPLVRLELRTAWDPLEEPPGKAGLGGCLAELLKSRGAGSLESGSFQRFLEERYLRFSFSMQPRSFCWSVLSDSQGQDDAFESLAIAATRPALESTAMEARRQIHIKEFKERTPRMRAEDQFLRRVGDPSRGLLPDEGSINRIEFQDLVLLSHRVLRPENSVLVIQGDLNLPQAKQLTMLHLGAWGPSRQEALVPTHEPPSSRSPSTRTWVVRDASMAPRIRVGASSPIGAPLPESSLAICTWLVRRELSSALPTPLVKAEFKTFPCGAWVLETVASSGKSVSEAMGAVQQLLARLRGKAIGTNELGAARLAWNAERKSRVLHPQQEAASLADRALRFGNLDEGADRLKAEDVQTILQQVFSAEVCAYHVVGGAPQDDAWLVKAGLGPVETIN